MEKHLKRLGVFGIISLLSYTAMVVFSPLAYPGYDWLSMAVSDLCAEGAPSEALASQLNAQFGPSSVIAASSFAGEKEKHTLETLLYSPLSLRQLFQSKILAGFSVGMMVSYISFAAMLLAVEVEVLFLTGSLIIPGISWLLIMLLIAPAFSFVAIAVTVRSSAKAKTIEEAQKRVVFLIFPILALVIGQFTGILLINLWLLLGLGAVLVVLDVLLMRGAAGNFTYEKLLK